MKEFGTRGYTPLRLTNAWLAEKFPCLNRNVEGIPLGEVTEIELWRDEAGLSSDLFCDVIFLMDLESGILISKTGCAK